MLDFMTTLAKIKKKDPEIYSSKQNFFHLNAGEEVLAEKFEKEYEDRLNPLRKRDKLGSTVRDMVIKTGLQGAEADESEAEEAPKKEPMAKERERLRREFIEAGKAVEPAELIIKKKANAEKEISPEQLIAQQKHASVKEVDTLKQVWLNAETVDPNEQFLKDYILKQKWREGSGQGFSSQGKKPGQKEQSVNDEDDEAFEEKNDEFEQKWNFRYEEPGGNQLINYARNQPDSMRLDESARKNERLAKLQKKQNTREQMKQEMDMAKKFKKDEIMNKIMRLKQVSKSSAKEYEQLVRQALEGDFDEYDRIMNTLFGEEYYQEADPDEKELEKYVENVEQEIEKEFQKPDENPA